MVSIDWVVITFVLGALTGHLATRKASLGALYRAHLRGIEKGRLEQKHLIEHLERKANRLQAQTRKLTFTPSSLKGNEQLPNIPR